MGADAGDFDGDGRIDLVLTAFAHDRNTLYRNIDGRQFEDASVAAGLAAPTFTRMGWGTAFFDADLDGKLDLFFANGHIFADIDSYPQLAETFRQKNQLCSISAALPRRVGTRRRRPAGRARRPGPGRRRSRRRWRPGPRRQQHGRRADAAREPPTHRAPLGRVPTVAAPSRNRFAIGAKVTIDAGGRKQFREIRSGGSFLSQSDLRVSFGLGDTTGAVDVESDAGRAALAMAGARRRPAARARALGVGRPSQNCSGK